MKTASSFLVVSLGFFVFIGQAGGQTAIGNTDASFQTSGVSSKPKVRLPKEAKKTGLGGSVSVSVSLDEAGNVVSVDDVTGPGRVCKHVGREDVLALRDAARAAALKTKFIPAKNGGVAVASSTWVTFEFPGDKDSYENTFTTIGAVGDVKETNIKFKGDRHYSAVATPPSDYKGPVNTPEPDETQKVTPDSINSSKTLSGGVLNGKATELPKPKFPAAARAVRVTGAVPVQVLIDEKGEVFAAQAVSGHPLLKSSATIAACNAKFMPTLLSGAPVKVSGIITYNFVP